MDRIFLAVIVSGVLLAATSMSLFVVTDGATTVAELKEPSPAVAISSMRPLLRVNATRDDHAR